MKSPDVHTGTRTSPGTLVLGGLVVATVAAVATAAIAHDATPDVLTTGQAVPHVFQVDVQPFDDARNVALDVTAGTAHAVLATVSGTVTTFDCRPGRALRSGRGLATINSRRVVGLATGQPLWRSIRAGMRGTDIAALNRELRRLRAIPTNPGRLATARTIRSAAKLSGLPSTTRQVEANQFAWLPAPTVHIATCDALQGMRVAAGATLATLTATPNRVALAVRPTSAIAGPRVLEVDRLSLGLSKDDAVAAKDLTRFAQTPSFQRWTLSKGQVPIGGTWRLATPAPLAALPASAVAAGRTHACVAVGGRGVPVTIVTSSLGQSYVRFTGEVPEHVDVVAGEDLTCS